MYELHSKMENLKETSWKKAFAGSGIRTHDLPSSRVIPSLQEFAFLWSFTLHPLVVATLGNLWVVTKTTHLTTGYIDKNNRSQC